MVISHTRQMVRAALNGLLAGVGYRDDPNFGVRVPLVVPDVPSEVLDPRGTWADPEEYDRRAAKLAQMFADNFKKYAAGVSPAIAAAGPIVR
jgi:phosphoenolpyruvate carboxykinase (ATP)